MQTKRGNIYVIIFLCVLLFGWGAICGQKFSKASSEKKHSEEKVLHEKELKGQKVLSFETGKIYGIKMVLDKIINGQLYVGPLIVTNDYAYIKDCLFFQNCSDHFDGPMGMFQIKSGAVTKCDFYSFGFLEYLQTNGVDYGKP